MTRLLAATFSLTVLLYAGGASAQSTSAVAEALFREGRTLMDQKRYDDACAKFEHSQRLEEKLGTLLNLAFCNEKRGRYASAWAQFTQGAAWSRREGHADREQFAVERRDAVKSKLAHIVIVAPAGARGLSITLDGEPVAGAMIDTELPVDPGGRKVVVTAPHKQPWSTTVTIEGEATVTEVTIPLLDDAPAPLPPVPASAPAAPSSAAPAPRITPAHDGGSDYGWLVWTGFGVGGAGLLVGSITGVLSLVRTSRIEANCEAGTCPPSERGAIDSANTLANVSNVGFVVGGVGVVAGVIGLVIDGGDSEEAVAVRAMLGPGTLGLEGWF